MYLSSALDFSIAGRMYKGDIYSDQTSAEVAAHHLELSEGWHTVVVKGAHRFNVTIFCPGLICGVFSYLRDPALWSP